ncbi:type I secretion protein TolC [Massilia arenosa]|uniref:Type I secretion protein TolC n=1 Tax=Zemynaea arenosa TaxID=2561931 RepID=A0A4Y9SY02_9BURK|nr:TolC family outer membrane protein [Massilia arenosa]TFW30239.1 type I secretion protein TolC [Massilia arenosa]
MCLRSPLRPLRCLALAVAGLAAAGQAGAVTFMQAYEAALKNDPTYRISIHENAYTRENKALARAGLLPNVSASYYANKNRADLQTFGPFGGLTHPQYISRGRSVSMRQPLLDLEGIMRYREASAQVRSADFLLGSQTDQAVLRMASAYFDAALAKNTLALAIAQRDMYKEQAAVNARLFEKGEGTKTDMLETAARLDQAEAQVIEAQDTLAANTHALAEIIGMEPGELQEIKPEFRFAPLEPQIFEDWRAIALRNNKDVLAARESVEAARIDIQRSRSQHAPRVDLVAQYAKNDSETLNTYQQNSLNRSIGVQVNIPIFSGGQITAQTRQSAAGYERAQADLDARTGRVTLELRRAHDLVQSSVTHINALEKAVSSAQLLVTATTQSIKGGVRINLDLLNAQQQLINVKRDLAQARYAYLLAVLRLRVAAGTLDTTDVKTVATNLI